MYTIGKGSRKTQAEIICRTEGTPAPDNYHVDVKGSSSHRTSPKHSIKKEKRLKEIKDISPGPATYESIENPSQMNLGMEFPKSPVRNKYTTKVPGVGEYQLQKAERSRSKNPISYSIGKMKPYEILTPGGH